MPTVLVTAHLFHTTDWPYYEILRQSGFDVHFADRTKSLNKADQLVEALRGMDAVVCSTEAYTPSVLRRIKTRVISRIGVGYDSIDVAAATENDIAVCRTTGAGYQAAAEHAIGMIFALYRDVVKRNEEVRAGLWNRTPGPRLAGKTLGVVGLGMIGTETARMAVALGMRVIAYNRSTPSELPSGVELVPLEEIWKQSDVVSLHTACTPQTERMINAQTLAQMKDDALLINTARGGLIDEPDLAAAMKGGKLRGAALDVLQQEPAGEGHPLFAIENIYFSPHMAGLDQQSIVDMSNLAARNIIDLYEGRWPAERVVNASNLRDWKW
ncbi:phosphoglycerate dehydrogenase [Blastopirellula retiformator]|uniref:Glycerate dehydrogenase n=1 Tax=Blastopirellula retiformator TaxID=2527970 RepID=A0A5C5VB78_9BACT|nr:phosphoglycerate dehydrogenase [Blastopirellula retiformator]TWT34952.1 Glycerate dehydrogenase [Blastopirellula retiformator]